MGKMKDQWQGRADFDNDLVWDKALGAYVPRDKLIADPPSTRYKDPMNGDFDTLDQNSAMADDPEGWDAYGRDVRGGDSMEDFEAINRAASKDVARAHTQDSLAANTCPKCGHTPLLRTLAENGDVVATCVDCRSDFIDESYNPPTSGSQPSLSDLAAGRYGARSTSQHRPARGTQGDLWGGYGSGSGYGGYSSKDYGDWNKVFAVQKKDVRTSASHPLQVDFIKPEVHARSGRLGMTFAPGKKHYGMSAEHDRDLDADLKTLCQIGVNTLVCLIEDHEFDSLKVPELLERAQGVGIDTIWHPIKDFGVPHDTEAFLDLLNAIIDDLEAGKTVVVHCKGGLGRTGTVVASTLVALGWEPKLAIEHARKVRKGVVENMTQENYVAWIDSCFE